MTSNAPKNVRNLDRALDVHARAAEARRLLEVCHPSVQERIDQILKRAVLALAGGQLEPLQAFAAIAEIAGLWLYQDGLRERVKAGQKADRKIYQA